MEYFDSKDNEPIFEEWKQNFIERFRDESDLDKMRNKLHSLMQKPEQKTKAFIGKLNALYDSIYGKEKTASRLATEGEIALIRDIKQIRDDQKKKIILKGLTPKLRQNFGHE